MRTLITSRELGIRVRLTSTEVISAAERGEIPFIKVGETIRFDYADVMAHLKTVNKTDTTTHFQLKRNRMTETTIPNGVALAARLAIKAVQTELHSKAVEIFNLDVTAQGLAWDQLDTQAEELVDNAEDLDFEQLEEQLNSLKEWRLTYLQERLEFFKRRQGLLQAIHSEWEDNVAKCEENHAAVQKSVERKLNAAGKPQDTALWKRGATNLAQREFDEEVRTMDSVVQAQKAWLLAKENCRNVFPHNAGIDEAELRADLRKFVMSRVA